MRAAVSPLQLGGFIDIGGYVREAFAWYASIYLEAARAGLDVLLDIYAVVLREALTLDPSTLSSVETVYWLSAGLFLSLLSLLALSQLGLAEVFPRSQSTDPHRFAERAFIALVLIVVANPPGDGSLFAKGLFAWAFELVNALQNYLLADIGTLDVAMNLETPTESVSSVLRMAMTGGIVFVLLLVSLLLGQLALALREYVLVSVYALFPLLLAFWLVDVGPLKYARQVAEMAFQLAVVLLVAGVFIAGMLNASLTLLAGGTVGGEAATAQAVVESAGSQSGVVRGGVLAASSGESIQDMVAQVVFLTVAGFGVFGVLVVAVLQLFSTVGGGGGGGRGGRQEVEGSRADGGRGSQGRSLPDRLARGVGLGSLVDGQRGADRQLAVGDSGVVMGLGSGGNAEDFENPSVASDGDRTSVASTIDFSNTERVPKDHHEPKPVIGENEFLTLAKPQQEALEEALPEEYGDGTRNLPVADDGSIAVEDGFLQVDDSTPLTAADALDIHERWKLNESDEEAGLLWEKINRDVDDVDTPPNPPKVDGKRRYDEIDRAPEMELTDNARATVEELNTASQEFIRENHEELAVPSREEDGEIYLTVERGASSYRTGPLAKQALDDLDASEYEMPNNRAVFNYTADRTVSTAYAAGEDGSGAGIRTEVAASDVVLASDQIRLVEGSIDDSGEEYLMNDAEIQVAGDAVQHIDDDELVVWNGDEAVEFTEALEEPEQLGEEGHKNMTRILTNVESELDDTEAIGDESAKEQIKTWASEVDENDLPEDVDVELRKLVGSLVSER